MKVGDIITLVAVVFLLVSVVGFVLDRPILISYVTSESMTPTLNKGDIFLINPLSKGNVGDIIVFKMNGRWTVHRIYADTPNGYITKGDNNIATDQQDGRNKPIRKEDVAGVVVTLWGNPIKIPYIGNYIQEASKSTLNLCIAIVVIVLGSIMMTGERGKRKKKRTVKIKIKYKTLYTIVASITVAVVLLSVVATWGTIGFSYASTLAGGQKEGWYLPNTEFNKTVYVQSKTIYPTVYIVSPVGNRISVERCCFVLRNGEKVGFNVFVKVPSDTHIYYERINVYSYPLTLPPDVIVSMWKISPYFPLLSLASELACVLALVYFLTSEGNEDVVRLKIRRRMI